MVETDRREKSEEKTDRQERHEFFGLERSREVCTRKTGQSNALLGIFKEYRNSSTEMVIVDQQLRAMEGYIYKSDGIGRCKV